MIRHLTLKDVGPTRTLDFSFAPRLNVFTGDNGLGKTFVLDVLWWVLTTTWAGEKAFPWRPPDGGQGDFGQGDLTPSIAAVLCKRASQPLAELEVESGGVWGWASQEWARTPWQPRRQTPGPTVYPTRHDEAEFRPRSLVLYARIDGSFAVWDSYYVKGGIHGYAEAAIVLTPAELWDGKDASDPEVQGGKRTVIGGLISDWVSWQQRVKSPEFEALCRVLQALAPPDETLTPGEPTRVHLRDRRDIPTLSTSCGVVPVTLASAGMRRALSLAYLLVWAWTEHSRAAKQSRQEPTRDLVLLLDEPELHQHPAWQRVFLPAILQAIASLAPEVGVQVFTATHAPMVLASLESVFREDLDDLFVLERDGRVVKATELPFGKEGDVGNWLESTVFGGVGGRSREAKLAIDAAMDFMANRMEEAERNLSACNARLANLIPLQVDDPKVLEWADAKYRQLPLVERIHAALLLALSSHDPFWVQWVRTWHDHARSLVRP